MDLYNDTFSEYYTFDNEKSIELTPQSTELNITDENKFVCDVCGLSYKYYSGLYMHKRNHNPNYIKKYSCSVCQHSTDNIIRIKNHKNIHLGQECEIIINQRKLTDKESKYKKIYNPEDNTYKCPLCNKIYQSRQSIEFHIKMHYPTRTYKFSCTECDFKTDRKGAFTRHKNSH